MLYEFLNCAVRATCSGIPIHLELMNVIIFSKEYKFLISRIWKFLHLPVTSSHGSKYSPQHRALKYPLPVKTTAGLLMEAVSFSEKCSISTRLHDATSQMAVIFILVSWDPEISVLIRLKQICGQNLASRNRMCGCTGFTWLRTVSYGKLLFTSTAMNFRVP
jgi:hypothetical protein